jgi:hypothetical protein
MQEFARGVIRAIPVLGTIRLFCRVARSLVGSGDSAVANGGRCLRMADWRKWGRRVPLFYVVILGKVGPHRKGNLERSCLRGVDESPADIYESSVEIILTVILTAVCYSCESCPL